MRVLFHKRTQTCEKTVRSKECHKHQWFHFTIDPVQQCWEWWIRDFCTMTMTFLLSLYESKKKKKAISFCYLKLILLIIRFFWIRLSFGCDCVREIKVPFLKTAHSNSVIVCSYGVIMYITRTHVVPNTNELLSSVEHKRRCETEWYSQSPFTFIVGKKDAMQVNGDWIWQSFV